MRASWLASLSLLVLAGCVPIHSGPHGDYDIAFARAYVRAKQPDVEALTVPQLYAAHRYLQNSTHTPRGLTGEFVRRGAAAVPHLRAQLADPQSFPQLTSVLEIIRDMQTQGTFDARDDPTLIALIQQSANAFREPGGTTVVRDLADEIETGTRFPTRWPPWGRRPFEGLGNDYDRDFARAYCRGCDFQAWRVGAIRLSIPQLYAVQRYGWEALPFPRDIDFILAMRGESIIPFFKQKLAQGGTGFMVWNILSVLQQIQDGSGYDVSGDAELMRLAQSAVARVRGGWSPHVRRSLDRLRSGAR